MNTQPLFKRLHGSWTAIPEKRLLLFLAARMPAFVTPDVLTATGVFGGMLVCLGYILSGYGAGWIWLANAGLIVHWFGDSLDGTLARFRQVERPRYGYFVDQTVDVITNCLICFGMGWSPFVAFDVALLALNAYHMVSIYAFVRNVVAREFLVSALGIGPTEIRIGIVLLNLGILAFGAEPHAMFGREVTWCDGLVLLAALAFMVSFIAQVYVFALQMRETDREEAEARR